MNPQRFHWPWLILAVAFALSFLCCATHPRPAPPSPIHSAENLETFDVAWQIINDTHFDTNFNGVNWKAVREELRPRAEKAQSRDELREILENMLGRLGESHMKILPREVVDYVRINVTNRTETSA